MKRLLVIVIFIITPLIGVTQIKGGSYFSLNGGVSVPVGAYSENKFSQDINYGFAKTGVKFSLETRIKVYKRFGLGIYLGTPFHTLDKHFLENRVRSVHNYPAPKYDVNVGSRLNVYGGIVAMSGLSYSYPCKNFAFDLKVLGGVSSWVRDIDIIVRENNKYIYEERYVFNEGLWPIILIGTDVRYNTKGRFGLKFGINYNKVLKGKTNSDLSTYTANSSGYISRSAGTRKAKAPVSYFNFEMGIVLHFKNNKIKRGKLYLAVP